MSHGIGSDESWSASASVAVALLDEVAAGHHRHRALQVSLGTPLMSFNWRLAMQNCRAGRRHPLDLADLGGTSFRTRAVSRTP